MWRALLGGFLGVTLGAGVIAVGFVLYAVGYVQGYEQAEYDSDISWEEPEEWSA